MKADRCQAIAASGQPCAATPRPGRPYCLWHDPEAADLRAELSRKGGRARSNQARAKRQFPAGVMTNAELLGLVGMTMRGVLAGRIEPGAGNSVAALSKAYLAIAEAAAVEELTRRLDDLERVAARGRPA